MENQSTDLRPLPIYPWPLNEVDYGAVRLAKARLGVEWKVLPRPAIAGSPGRILALREPPPFLCDYALVNDPQNGNSMLAALEVALGLKDDERMNTVLDTLKSIFGEGVREIPAEELAAEEETGPPMPDFGKAFDLNDQKKGPVFR